VWFLSIVPVLVVSVLEPTTNPAVEITAESVMRSDLPNDFPFQVFDVGFAVLKIRVKNVSNQQAVLDPATFQAKDPKGKRLKRVEPVEVTPKLMKFYRSGGPPSIHGEVGYGYPPYPGAYPPHRDRRPTVGVGVPAGKVDVSTGGVLRELLERYQLSLVVLEPGQEVQGFIYLESKKSGRALSGGRVTLADLATEIQ
jgi:hypothetical protein